MPLDVKLVLVGDLGLHDPLYALDPDFRKLFGVRAEFASDVPRTQSAQRSYAAVVAGLRARAAAAGRPRTPSPPWSRRAPRSQGTAAG